MGFSVAAGQSADKPRRITRMQTPYHQTVCSCSCGGSFGSLFRVPVLVLVADIFIRSGTSQAVRACCWDNEFCVLVVALRVLYIAL